MPIHEGEAAPQFTLPNQDGEKVSLEDFEGRMVVVYFYPKDDTPGCTKEACGFRDLWGEISDTGAAVLGISPDDVASHSDFASKYDLPFTLLADPDHEVMEAYGAWGEKNMYGKKVTGVIRSTVLVGPDGIVKKRWKRVTRAADHPSKVLEEIRRQADAGGR